MKLEIELVPYGSWGANLRAFLTPDEWKKIQGVCFRRASYRCEICGGRGPKHWVECHEEWHYDDKKHIQTLDRVVALCPACHRVKHMGNAQKNGLLEKALAHMGKVNEMTRDASMKIAVDAFAKWNERSRFKWTVVVEPELTKLLGVTKVFKKK